MVIPNHKVIANIKWHEACELPGKGLPQITFSAKRATAVIRPLSAFTTLAQSFSEGQVPKHSLEACVKDS